jgi:hypothetical protein
MAGVPAEPLRSHTVQVSETWYPVKQVLERTTGVGRSDFISTGARRQLKKLGFPVRHDESRPKLQWRPKRAWGYGASAIADVVAALRPS